MLEWTGERFLPWIKESTIAYEHLHRYAYASTFVKNKRVLDLACGEGYGSEMLAASAASVAGIDVDEGAVRHAVEKYGRTNLQFITGSITAIPIQDNHSFDVIVCFEAIEHIEDQEKLLGEVKRLLKPDGLFIVSTPNKVAYHDESEENNPFHVKELYFEEFQQLLARHFQTTRFFGQRIHPGSSIWPIAKTSSAGLREFVMQRTDSDFEFISSAERVPMYFIAIASDSEIAVLPAGSVLLDQSDGLIKEKDQELRSATEAIDWRGQQIRAREETIASLEEAARWHEEEIGKLKEGIDWTRNRVAELEETVSSIEQALAWRLQQVTDLETALAWRLQQVSELETAMDFWKRESASLNMNLQSTQRRFSLATEKLEGIYASRGWKLITRLREIRNKLMGRAKPRA